MTDTHETEEPGGKTLLLCPYLRQGGGKNQRTPESQREEAVGLAHAIELILHDVQSVPMAKIHPASYFGKGKVEELAAAIAAETIALVVVDTALSPIQQRNLERAFKCKVIDRTQLILEIFGDRAQTREGRLQVELASLMYQKSRLVRSWTHLERQRGGAGFMGGPGERQIEIDRRIIQDRITLLKKQLQTVERTRELHRKKRRTVPYPIVALVGYTNAGKSTLFNRLTGAGVHAEDQLFATLDPTLRQIRLPSGMQVILSDTVGFVSNLPTMLVAAFRATLEEVLEADVIVHVRDVAHPDTELQKQDVLQVLAELGIAEERQHAMLEACNKCDLLDEPAREALEAQVGRNAQQLVLSAATGEGIAPLLEAIEALLLEDYLLQEVTLACGDGKAHAWLHAHATVQEEHTDDEGRIGLQCLISRENWAKFQAHYAAAGART